MIRPCKTVRKCPRRRWGIRSAFHSASPSHNCGTNYECQDLTPTASETWRGFLCNCPTGYYVTIQSQQTVCIDVNECNLPESDSRHHGCPEHSTCVKIVFAARYIYFYMYIRCLFLSRMFHTHTVPFASVSTVPSIRYVSSGESKDDGRVPMIIDTDVGNDIDDAFALTLAFKLHRAGKINILCVTTSGKGSHDERAGLVMRLQLAVLGDAPVPVYMGSDNDDTTKKNYMSCAIPGPFEKFADNVESVVSSVRAASQKVLVLCIGPLDNIELLLDGFGDDAKSLVRLCLMGGSFFKSFDAQPPQIAEYNVRHNIPNWQRVVRTMDALVVPLDIAGAARFKDWPQRLDSLLEDFRVMYFTWYESILQRDPLSRILRGTMPGEVPVKPGKVSSVMFDAVALCVALHPEVAHIRRSAVEVTDSAVEVMDKGKTNFVQGGNQIDVALGWAPGFETFFEEWVDSILQ